MSEYTDATPPPNWDNSRTGADRSYKTKEALREGLEKGELVINSGHVKTLGPLGLIERYYELQDAPKGSDLYGAINQATLSRVHENDREEFLYIIKQELSQGEVQLGMQALAMLMEAEKASPGTHKQDIEETRTDTQQSYDFAVLQAQSARNLIATAQWQAIVASSPQQERWVQVFDALIQTALGQKAETPITFDQRFDAYLASKK